MASNYEAALKAETKKVVRCFQPYGPEARGNHAASHRLGHRQRTAMGSFFYTHPEVSGLAFETRGAAARAALQVSA